MSLSVGEILAACGGRLVNGPELGDRLERVRVSRPAPLSAATEGDVAFFFSREYQNELPAASPGVLVTGEAFVEPMKGAGLPFWSRTAVIACADPYLAMALLSEKLADGVSSVGPRDRPSRSVVHPSAVVHETAVLGSGVEVGPNCVIEAGATIGSGTRLYPGCFVGEKARLGEDCTLFASVVIYEWTQVGDRVRIHSGVVLGADGFGYAPRRDGAKVTGHQKIWHLGRVIIGDDVEIGALSCVDRGTMGDTVVERQAKIDNQVHIGHNAKVAEGAILCGGVCLAGGASVGSFAYIGGMTGISNKIRVGAGALVGACSLISKDVAPGASAVGNPQRDYKEHFKAHAALNRMVSARASKKTKEG